MPVEYFSTGKPIISRFCIHRRDSDWTHQMFFVSTLPVLFFTLSTQQLNVSTNLIHVADIPQEESSPRHLQSALSVKRSTLETTSHTGGDFKLSFSLSQFGATAISKEQSRANSTWYGKPFRLCHLYCILLFPPLFFCLFVFTNYKWTSNSSCSVPFSLRCNIELGMMSSLSKQ